MKKILALALVVVMVFALSATAFAASDNAALKDGDANQFDDNRTTATLPLSTGFVVSNSEGDSSLAANKPMAYPTVEYAYTLAPADVTGKSVESPEGSKVAVKAGKLKAVTIGSTTGTAESESLPFTIKVGEGDQLAYNSVTLNDKGQEVVLGKTDILFTAANFDAPGVYRFKLSENATTNDANRLAAGVIKSTNVAGDHFIDVYVGYRTYTDTVGGVSTTQVDQSTLVINGYTLLSSNVDTLKDDDGDGTPNEPENADKAKESGIEDIPTKEPDTPTPDDPTDDKLDTSKLTGGIADITVSDMYYTYNVEVSKVVTGAMGDTEHEFPFAATVTEYGNMKWLVKGAISADGSTTNDSYTSELGNVVNYNLKNGDKAIIIGLPPFAKVNFTETQDTESVYTVTVKNGAATPAEITPVFSDGNTNKLAAKAVTVKAYNEGQEVTTYNKSGTVYTAKLDAVAGVTKTEYTNDLPQVSPTGVVLRVAPYVFILAAAAMLVVLAKRRQDEENA